MCVCISLQPLADALELLAPKLWERARSTSCFVGLPGSRVGAQMGPADLQLLRHYWARAMYLDRNSVVAPGQQLAAQEQSAKLRGILAKLKEKDAEANAFRIKLLRLQPPSYAEAAMLSPLLAQIRSAVAHDERE